MEYRLFFKVKQEYLDSLPDNLIGAKKDQTHFVFSSETPTFTCGVLVDVQKLKKDLERSDADMSMWPEYVGLSETKKEKISSKYDNQVNLLLMYSGVRRDNA